MATEYVVLRREGTTWHEVTRTVAASARAAISSSFNGKTSASPPDGEYVATPARSWQPVTVKVERTVKIG